MMFILSLALGVFGGLWLFTKWGEWREGEYDRWLERQQRREAVQAYEAQRQAERAEYERALAMRPPPPPAAPLIQSGPWIGILVVGGQILFLVALCLLG